MGQEDPIALPSIWYTVDIYIYKTAVFVCVLALYRPCPYPGAVLRIALGTIFFFF